MTDDATPREVGATAVLGPLPKHDHAFADPEGELPDILAWSAESMRKYAATAVAAERERCALICEEAQDQYDHEAIGSIAAERIRNAHAPDAPWA